MPTVVPKEIENPAIRSNLPTGYVFCDPAIGFAHGSFKNPLNLTDLLHYADVDGNFHTVHLLVVANLFDSKSPQELYLISIKHHLKEGWYFVDGAVLSSDATHATRFLVDDPVYERDPKAMEELNITLHRVIPEMLRKSGVSSIQPILYLTKYTWSVY